MPPASGTDVFPKQGGTKNETLANRTIQKQLVESYQLNTYETTSSPLDPKK